MSTQFRQPGTVTARLLLALALLPLAGPLVTAQAISCAGFDSQIWAQSAYDTDPAGFAALDPDGNGLACEALPPGAAPAWWTSQIPSGASRATLVGVTDGDTIRVKMGGQAEPVRLILIDTPETHDPNNPAECFGQEATDYLTWLLSLGGTLYLETDVSNRDRFDRLLRYAWLDFGNGEVYLVNEAMVRAGYAALATFPPDLKYVQEIREAARFAREHGYGLWSGCQTDAAGDTNEVAAAPDAANAPGQGIVSNPAPAAMPIAGSGSCDSAYPDACIPPAPPDLDCGDVAARRFTVLPPDPHNFDGDFDGVGCERG